jgi:DNA-binding MurR/RpiR family transcriptional regulator
MRNQNNDALQVLARHYQKLSPQLQIAAQYMIDHPDDVALLSMRALAKNADVQPVTISRLVRSIGYDSYEELRNAFQQRLRAHDGEYTSRLQEIHRRGMSDEAVLLQELLQQEQINVQQLMQKATLKQFSKVAATLEGARRIYVLGLRGAYSIAYFFHYCYQMFDENSVLLEGAGGVFADQLRHIGKDDCLLAISSAPYSKAVVQAAEMAQDAGASILTITDSQLSPLALMAKHSIVCETTSPSFYQSFGSAMAACQGLIALLVMRAGDEAIEALRGAETQLEKFGAYW